MEIVRGEGSEPVQPDLSGYRFVVDRYTHQPIPWAEVSTDFQFAGAFFSTSADQNNGNYWLNTLAEPQDVLVRVNGERMPRVGVGRPWFSWTPRGSEKTDAG